PHLGGEVPDAGQQYVHRVAGGLDELQVVARVPPSAGGVDGRAERRQVALEVTAAVGVRREVRHRGLVVQVPGRGAKCVGDEVRAITLRAVEEQRVGQGSGVEARAGVDAERRRG